MAIKFAAFKQSNFHEITFTEGAYTTTVADIGYILYCNESTATTITISALAEKEIGDKIVIYNAGDGEITLVPESGSITPAFSNKVAKNQKVELTLINITTNAWAGCPSTCNDPGNYFNTTTGTSDDITQGSTNLFVSSTQKTQIDNSVQNTLTVTGDNGLSGGGALSANLTISGVDATTSAKGVVQLYDNVDSDSTTLAATANSVKQVNDALDNKADKVAPLDVSFDDTTVTPTSGSGISSGTSSKDGNNIITLTLTHSQGTVYGYPAIYDTSGEYKSSLLTGITTTNNSIVITLDVSGETIDNLNQWHLHMS